MGILYTNGGYSLKSILIYWCVLYTPDLTSPDTIGYTIDSTTGAWSHKLKFTLPRHLFTHLGFPVYPCCLGCKFVPGCSCLWTADFRLMDDGRLFPSLYYQVHQVRYQLDSNMSNTKLVLGRKCT